MLFILPCGIAAMSLHNIDNIVFGFPEQIGMGPREPKPKKTDTKSPVKTQLPIAEQIKAHVFEAMQEEIRELKQERAENFGTIVRLNEQLRKTNVHKAVLHKYISDLLTDQVDAAMIIDGLNKAIKLSNEQKLTLLKILGKPFLNKNQDIKEFLLPFNPEKQILDLMPFVKSQPEYAERVKNIMNRAGEDILRNVIAIEPHLPTNLPVSSLSNILGS